MLRLYASSFCTVTGVTLRVGEVARSKNAGICSVLGFCRRKTSVCKKPGILLFFGIVSVVGTCLGGMVAHMYVVVSHVMTAYSYFFYAVYPPTPAGAGAASVKTHSALHSLSSFPRMPKPPPLDPWHPWPQHAQTLAGSPQCSHGTHGLSTPKPKPVAPHERPHVLDPKQSPTHHVPGTRQASPPLAHGPHGPHGLMHGTPARSAPLALVRPIRGLWPACLPPRPPCRP